MEPNVFDAAPDVAESVKMDTDFPDSKGKARKKFWLQVSFWNRKNLCIFFKMGTIHGKAEEEEGLVAILSCMFWIQRHSR